MELHLPGSSGPPLVGAPEGPIGLATGIPIAANTPAKLQKDTSNNFIKNPNYVHQKTKLMSSTIETLYAQDFFFFPSSSLYS